MNWMRISGRQATGEVCLGEEGNKVGKSVRFEPWPVQEGAGVMQLMTP